MLETTSLKGDHDQDKCQEIQPISDFRDGQQ